MKILEKYRTQNNLSCEKLAELVGVSKATVSRHCRGFPIDSVSAIKYRDRLGIPFDEFFPPSEDLTNPPEPSQADSEGRKA